jgi:hypothetical protein
VSLWDWAKFVVGIFLFATGMAFLMITGFRRLRQWLRDLEDDR